MMTLEERADYIACAMLSRSINGYTWRKVRDRALAQLREVAGENHEATHDETQSAGAQGSAQAHDEPIVARTSRRARLSAGDR